MSDIPLVINWQFVKRPLSHSRIVFNDSMSFSYGLGTGTKDPMKKSKNYGSKVIHHSILSFKDSDVRYIGVNNSSDKKSFFIIDTFKKKEWVFTEDSKTIIGFKCKKAFWVNRSFVQEDSVNKQVADSTIAWYTNEIPLPFGPTEYRGLPGLVLEIFQPTSNGEIRISAMKIEKEDFTIGISPGTKIVLLSGLKKDKK